MYHRKIFVYILGTFLSLSVSCQNVDNSMQVMPKHFYQKVPFTLTKHGMRLRINTGKHSSNLNAYFDNLSPSFFNQWFDKKGLQKAKGYQYKTKTFDGTPIGGDIYIIDTLGIDRVTFVRIPAYEIKSDPTSDPTNVVIGENIISKAIWKIDFKNKQMSLSSNFDSLGAKDALLMPSQFKDYEINLRLKFQNKIIRSVKIDMGFNGGICVPLTDFEEIVQGNPKKLSKSLELSTPTGSQMISSFEAFDSVQLGKSKYPAILQANARSNEYLIGRHFFMQFEYYFGFYQSGSLLFPKSTILTK